MICNENLVEDEYHLLITSSAYKVICEKFDDLLDGHDNMNAIFKCPPRSASTSVCTLFSHVF